MAHVITDATFEQETSQGIASIGSSIFSIKLYPFPGIDALL